MKIGVFVGDFSPEIGGGYTFQQEIYRAIELYGHASGHKFVFFTLARGVFSKTSNVNNIEIISIPDVASRNLLFILCHTAARFFVNAISRWISIDNLDEIVDPISGHIKKLEIDLIWSLTPSCCTLEIPFIATVWDLQHRLQPYFPEVSIKQEWEGRERVYSGLLRKASYVITGTETGKLEIEKFYQVPGERVRVLPLPTPQFIAADNHVNDGVVLQKYDLPETYLFYPAQFWPHKNHYGILMGLKALREKFNVCMPVVFVGSDMGNLAYIRKVVVDLGLTGQVHYLGFVPRDDLVILYKNAFALLYLSLFGPDNLPPLEAFALGCPVIASNVSGAEEQLGNAALLVNPNDPNDIADAINLLQKDIMFRQKLVKLGTERASKWTGEKYFKGVCSIFNEFENIRRTWSNSVPFKLVR